MTSTSTTITAAAATCSIFITEHKTSCQHTANSNNADTANCFRCKKGEDTCV